MPIYDFKCKKCGIQFDALCKMGDDKSVTCLCGSNELERLVSSSVGFAFSDPKDTSKFDNFSYRAGHNMEKAKAERRNAEKSDHMGTNPYNDPDIKSEN